MSTPPDELSPEPKEGVTDAPKCKGFLALDLDGTTILQRIDHFVKEGLVHPESHIRLNIIEYIKAARDAGYDIVILTARPSMVEPVLKSLKVGTKSTDAVIDILTEHGITIESIERTSGGLKGNKMQEILARYHDRGIHDAVGVLFDDQLKQVNDVLRHKNEQLLAYDINSSQDLMSYIELVNQSKTVFREDNPSHPTQIIEDVIDPVRNLPKEASEDMLIPEVSQRLKFLRKKIGGLTDESCLSPFKEKLKHVLNDLCLRFYESHYRSYRPEETLVSKIVINLNQLLDELPGKRPEHREKAVENTCLAIFGKDNPVKLQVNTTCERLVKELLTDLKTTFAGPPGLSLRDRLKKMFG